MGDLLGKLRAALTRRLLGVTAEEIRYTFDDVRKELRATRTELLGEVAALRADLDSVAAHDDAAEHEKPVAEA